jgi:hypothetical protein
MLAGGLIEKGGELASYVVNLHSLTVSLLTRVVSTVEFSKNRKKVNERSTSTPIRRDVACAPIRNTK